MSDQASGNPLFPSIYPQNQGLPTLLFHALTYTSDFMGGWTPLPLLEKELAYSSKSIKIPGHDKSVSALDSSEGYLAHLYRFVRPHVIVYNFPIWEARDVLDLLKANYFGELEIISIYWWRVFHLLGQ